MVDILAEFCFREDQRKKGCDVERERRGPEKARTIGGKVAGGGGLKSFQACCGQHEGTECTRLVLWPETRLRSLLDAFLDPAQAKNVHSGCWICFLVTDDLREKYQERRHSTNVIKMKMNNDPAKNGYKNSYKKTNYLFGFYIWLIASADLETHLSFFLPKRKKKKCSSKIFNQAILPNSIFTTMLLKLISNKEG